MKREFTSYAPPGTNIPRELGLFGGALALAVLHSLGFLTRYWRAYDALFEFHGSKRVLMEGALMEDFDFLLDRALWGFPLIALILLALVVWNYLSYRQDSMSIYLMRRLPDRGLLHRQCLTLPLLGIVLCVVTALVLLCIYHLIYLNCTPVQCLPVSYGR